MWRDTLPQNLKQVDINGVIRTISDTPPTHYMVKIEGFSLFEKHDIKKYSTAEFEVGGYKWKLILYPKGNKPEDGNENISVYLMVVESSLPDLGSDVHAVFRVFLLHQNDDSYYTLQVINGRRFHKMKLEWGFEQFMLLSEFNDPANGYLVNDTCVFGAEVYVCKKNNIKGEHLVMMKDTNSYKHTWEIESFSTIATNVGHESVSFNCGGHKWKIRLYPNGNSTGEGSHISVFLILADPAKLSIASQIFVECTINIIDQVHAKNKSCKLNYWFSSSNTSYGYPRFIPFIDFNASSNGYLVKDSCIIEAEVIVHGVTSTL